MVRIYTVFVLLVFSLTVGAQNLVPNGDFEQYDTCQTSFGQLYRALHWSDPIQPNSPPYTTPDYFHACNPNPLLSMPVNAWGYEYARSGLAYAAIVTAVDSTPPSGIGITKNSREYIQTELLDTLETNRNYCIKFYVSACDSMNFVSNNIGVYFSKTQIKDTCHRCTLSYIPQLENIADLSNRTGWTEISGSYTAIGGEKYIVIGNFRDSTFTITTYTNWVAYDKNRNTAIYYVDDVSLTLCDTAASILDGVSKLFIKLYPNPSSGIFYVELEADKTVNLQVFDAIGNLICQKRNFKNRDSPIDISNHANGIYLLKFSNGIFHRQLKIIKE